MPTYEYVCNACGHEFELFQTMTDAVKRKCPECGKNSLERLIGTGAGVIFKGSGFYETDYRSESYRKAADAEKKPASADTSTTAPKKGENSTPTPPSTPKESPAPAAESTPAKTAPQSGGRGKLRSSSHQKRK